MIRKSLIGLAALMFAMIAIASTARAQGGGVVGVWLCTITSTDNSFPPFQILDTITSDGTEVIDANNDLSPQSLSSPTHCAWKSTGHLQFVDRCLAFSYDQNANPDGMFIISDTLGLDKSNDSLTGTGQFKIVDMETSFSVRRAMPWSGPGSRRSAISKQARADARLRVKLRTPADYESAGLRKVLISAQPVSRDTC